MKFLSLVIITFLFKVSNAQLVSVSSYKSSFKEEKGFAYNKLGFTISYQDGIRIIKSLSGDKVLFAPPQKSYYGIFNGKYIVVTLIDTSVYKRTYSTLPCMFPRNVSYIIPINSLNNSIKVYKVNFNGIIIPEEFKTFSTPEKEYYRITNIDTLNKKIVIRNKVDKKNKLEFEIVPVEDNF